MAKTYLSAVKYEIAAKYEVDGIVEKTDIIGAIFGQSEGLLGEDMDLKDLQQAGKLGRIEITVNKGKGKTSGEITIPSSLDQIKTSILAAAVETVEKVGPCDTKIKILKISDARKEKRGQITDRAKELLKRMQKFESVESDEIAGEIRTNSRTQKITTYNGLVAGPEVKTNNTIIVVEGRADVLKLLSFGINNAVAMNGNNIDKSLVDLCKEKEVVVLIDGDRGGDMNVKKLASITKVDYVSKAPDGKEVEELTQKEILQALKRKVSIDDYGNEKPAYQNRNDHRSSYNDRRGSYDNRRNNYDRRGSYDNRRNEHTGYNDRNSQGNSRGGYRDRNDRNNGYRGRTDRDSRGGYRDRNDRNNGYRGRNFDPFQENYRPSKANTIPSEKETKKVKVKTEKPKTSPPKIKNIEKEFSKIKGSLKARFYDSKNKKIKDVKVKEIIEALEKSRKNVTTIAFDGIVTKRLIQAAENKKVKNIVGVRKGTAKSDKLNIITM